MESNAEMLFEYTGEGCAVPKNVTSVRFPSTVVEVEDEAFQSCNSLIEVVFNDGLQKIGRAAFHKCASLSSVTLSSTVIEIGSYAFYGCNNLRGVQLNEVLQKIGVSAFRNCKSLSSITLPSTVTSLKLLQL